jgi:hypothetical protein
LRGLADGVAVTAAHCGTPGRLARQV